MDFRPSPAQQLLVSTARDFLRKHCPPELVQRVALDARGVDDALWRRMAELGWQGLLVPADFGGSDGSLLDVILLTEEIGRAVAPGPFVPSAVNVGPGSIRNAWTWFLNRSVVYSRVPVALNTRSSA